MRQQDGKLWQAGKRLFRGLGLFFLVSCLVGCVGVLPHRTGVEGVYTNRLVAVSHEKPLRELACQWGQRRVAISVEEDASVQFSTTGGFDGRVLSVHGTLSGSSGSSGDRFVPALAGPGDIRRGSLTTTLQEAPGVIQVERKYRVEVGAGYAFDMLIRREVSLLLDREIPYWTGLALPSGMKVVGYESVTTLKNPGPLPWTGTGGLPYIRVEGTFDGTRRSVVVANLVSGDASGWSLHPAARPLVTITGSVVLVRGNTQQKGAVRVPLPAGHLLPRLACLDLGQGTLTLIAYSRPVQALGAAEPVASEYDPDLTLVPLAAQQMRYRFSSSTAGRPLATGGTSRHLRRTLHMEGAIEDLIRLAAAFCALPEADLQAALLAKGLIHE